MIRPAHNALICDTHYYVFFGMESAFKLSKPSILVTVQHIQHALLQTCAQYARINMHKCAYIRTPADINVIALRTRYLSGLFFLLGGSSALPAKTALVTTILAARPDLQGGEIAGALANLSSVTKVVMPQV